MPFTLHNATLLYFGKELTVQMSGIWKSSPHSKESKSQELFCLFTAVQQDAAGRNQLLNAEHGVHASFIAEMILPKRWS